MRSSKVILPPQSRVNIKRVELLFREECAYLRSISPKVPTDTVRLIARIIIKLRGGGNKTVAVLPDGSRRRFDDLMSHAKEIVRDSCRIRAFEAFFGVLMDCFKEKVTLACPFDR